MRGEIDRWYAVKTSRTIRIRETGIAVTCPKCEACSTVLRSTKPKIDACGFERYLLRCRGCASLLGGIIDPSDGALVVSLLE